MTPDEFDAAFDVFTRSAFRLEGRPVYAVGGAEAARIDAWRVGRPRPPRSVRTSPWLRRIALTTASGRHWARLRVVDTPMPDYLRYQLLGYVESAAVGEEIRLIHRAAFTEITPPLDDFWLFDADDREAAFAIAMTYTADGRPLADERVDDRGRLRAYRAIRDAAWAAAVPLADFLSTDAAQVGAA